MDGCVLIEVHTGQQVYPIAEESDGDTIVAMCNGEKVAFAVEDLQTIDGKPLALAVA